MLALVGLITTLDVLTAQATQRRHARSPTNFNVYRDRSGFPNGINEARRSAQR
jgi:hypothetical protein